MHLTIDAGSPRAALMQHGEEKMKLLRRQFLSLSVGAGVISIALQSAGADTYPSRSVKIIEPIGAGTAGDRYLRSIAQELENSHHQAFVVENRPGAGTTIGTDYVAHAAPDGYTLLMMSTTSTVNETLYAHKSYQLMRDLVPIAPLLDSDLVLVVHPSVPVHNLSELIALARAKPGTLNYGSSGLGSNYHMAAELLKNLSGINIIHVPYKGSTGMRTDILSGQIQLLFDAVPNMAPFIETGQVRALGTSGTTRSSVLPNVPTIAEAGVPGFQATLWDGLMAPRGTPQPIIDLLHREITGFLSRPEFKASWEKQGVTPLIMTQAEFTTFIESQIVKWAKVIKSNHIALVQ
jgi:tripartite-type tricarboxylate transporter receptor subunit TctC